MTDTYSVPLKTLVKEFNLEVTYASTDFDAIRITVEDVARPGLQLAGYFDHYEPMRLQVMGNVEMSYVDKLQPKERGAIFDRLFSYKFPALLIARVADGALRDALSLLDQCRVAQGQLDSRAVLDILGLAGSVQTVELMDCILRRDAAGALTRLDGLYRGGKDVAAMLGELGDLARDMTILKAAPDGAAALLADALAVQAAGAFAVVLECVPPKLAALVTRKLDIITIGIGAGAGCDGQVLVWQDMLGLNGDKVPKFVRCFAPVGQTMTQAFRAYDREVKAGAFPAVGETYAQSDCGDDVLARLEQNNAAFPAAVI